MLYAKNVLRGGELHDVLHDERAIKQMREDIEQGSVYIVKSGIGKSVLEDIREYLIGIGKGSLPAYQSIESGAPNFHRMNRWDERAYVKGCFHQFSFFPWNDDIFDFFVLFAAVYQLKNKLSGLPADMFLDVEPVEGCTARLSFQFYPCGGGALNRHADPVDHHQLTVPTMMLSKKGEDFKEGGAYVETEVGEKIYLDDLCNWGDIAYFNARVVHGVDTVDPGEKLAWQEFKGRMIALFAVNKFADNQIVGDSLDLEQS